MTAQQRVLLPRQSARSEALHPWETWTAEPSTTANAETASPGGGTSGAFTTSGLADSSRVADTSCTASSLNSSTARATVSWLFPHSTTAAGVSASSTVTSSSTSPLLPVSSSTTLSAFLTTSAPLDTAELSSSPSNALSTSSSTTTDSSVAHETLNQTSDSNLVQIQSDPATHGVLATSIVSSVLLLSAMSAVLGWWLVKRARNGYRYGLIMGKRKPMF